METHPHPQRSCRPWKSCGLGLRRLGLDPAYFLGLRRLGLDPAYLLAVVLTTLAGCRQEMYDQPRYEPLEPSSFFSDGTSARPVVAGTIARGQLDDDELRSTGKINGQLADQFPFRMTRHDLDRGRERFEIYCAPCHGAKGDGQGMIVQRGFPAPPSYYPIPGGAKRASPTGSTVPTYADLRQAPAGHFFDVITHGHGIMYSYASRVAVDDRWRIAAYIRVLQLGEHVTADDLKTLPKIDQDKLKKEAGQ